MDEITVRLASQDDWSTIVAFNVCLAEETENKRLDPDAIGPGVRAVLADENKGRYFVACDGSRIVGQLMHTFEWSDWRNGQIWWLQSVYVAPEFRRRGVFRRLYKHACDLADSDPGVVGIRLYVESENERARQTYRQMGMADAGYFLMERLFHELSSSDDD